MKKTMNKNEAIKFLLDSGLLFQINSFILHPLGLALVFKKLKNGFDFSGILDYRDVPENMIFDEEMLKNGFKKYKEYMKTQGNKVIEERFNSLGYVVQEDTSEVIMKTPEEARKNLLD